MTILGFPPFSAMCVLAAAAMVSLMRSWMPQMAWTKETPRGLAIFSSTPFLAASLSSFISPPRK